MIHNLFNRGRELYRKHTSISVYPVSRGTWTIEARVNGKSKKITGITTGGQLDQKWFEAEQFIANSSA